MSRAWSNELKKTSADILFHVLKNGPFPLQPALYPVWRDAKDPELVQFFARRRPQKQQVSCGSGCNLVHVSVFTNTFQ